MLLRTAKVSIVGLLISISTIVSAQVKLDYYLPEINYSERFPSPQQVLDYQVGEWHVTHDQLIKYMTEACASSPNCTLSEYARSYENRPLVYLTISSEENLAKIDQLKSLHNRLVTGPKIPSDSLDQIPLVLYQGYSIHGNESSGSNAAMLLAYYLLAGESSFLDKLLDENIILLDPCYNPDGLQRFSTWANMHKFKNLNPDPNSREFNEVWPGGRTNHYWFDLNRDWLFNIHPESKGRIEVFHEWKPDVLTDHHEMGSHSTFFFQPGIPSRTNPNTPQVNQDLTEKISYYHAAFLDSIGSKYYTKESFDDYYYGKGSTYPDINGCIGILFEQASSRGHLQETRNGLLSFPFTIRNQLVTSLSTQKAAVNLKKEILSYKQEFYQGKNRKKGKGAFVFSASDPYIRDFFLNMLRRHQVEVYQLKHAIDLDGIRYDPTDGYVVPLRQTQSELAKTIFEKVNRFPDSTFYDVSTWTIPLALNIPYSESGITPEYTDIYSQPFKNERSIPDNCVAVLADWEAYLAPGFLYELLANNIDVQVLTEPSSYLTGETYSNFGRGSLIIDYSLFVKDEARLTSAWLYETADRYRVKLSPIQSSLSPKGKSTGSPKAPKIKSPKIGMIVGKGVNAYEAGAAWYQCDQRWGVPVSLLDIHLDPDMKLDKYDVIILPDGQYSNRSSTDNKIKSWVAKGGILIAMRRAINYTDKLKLTHASNKKNEEVYDMSGAYEMHSHDQGSHVIGGAIFEAEIDLSHPLFFGYSQNSLPVFKRGTQFYELTDNPYAVPMHYSENPVLSGYCSAKNRDLASNSAALMLYGHGSGKIIAMVDNPNFRAYWLGGSKLFANALFYSQLIDNKTLDKG